MKLETWTKRTGALLEKSLATANKPNSQFRFYNGDKGLYFTPDGYNLYFLEGQHLLSVKEKDFFHLSSKALETLFESELKEDAHLVKQDDIIPGHICGTGRLQKVLRLKNDITEAYINPRFLRNITGENVMVYARRHNKPVSVGLWVNDRLKTVKIIMPILSCYDRFVPDGSEEGAA